MTVSALPGTASAHLPSQMYGQWTSKGLDMTNPQTGADARKQGAHADDSEQINAEHIDTHTNIDHVDATSVQLDRVGLSELLEVAVRIAPMQAHAAAVAKSLATLIAEHPAVPVRLAAISRTDSRVLLTLAVGLGGPDEIRAADTCACDAVALLYGITAGLEAADPALVEMPAADSAPALNAARLAITGDVVDILAAVAS